MLLNVSGRTVGTVVDEVSDVVQLGATGVAPVPECNGAVADTPIPGIPTLEQGGRQRMLILVDIDKLMTGAVMGLVEQTLKQFHQIPKEMTA
jgi:purine-binding chemotaxis protein CheW